MRFGILFLILLISMGCSDGGLGAPGSALPERTEADDTVQDDTVQDDTPGDESESDGEVPARDEVGVFDYDRSAPLDIEIEGEEARGGYTRVDLNYASPAGGRVPAFLYLPHGDGPFPAALVMHGMPGSRNNADGLASYHARSGAVAIAITAPFARPDDRPRANPILFTTQDRDEQIQLIQDLMRAVDLLMTRSDVKPDRIVYEGVSYGGAMGGLLAGVESRIRAYALVVGDGGLVAHVTGPEDANGPLYRMSKEQREAWLGAMRPIEPIRWVGRAAPAELLFQNGRRDPFVPPADGRAFQQAGSEPKTIMWYDAGHGLNDTANADRRAWLAERMAI